MQSSSEGLAPKRIVSLLSAATEILYGLGLEQRLAAVSHECDFPTDALTKPKATFSCIGATASSQAINDGVKAAILAGEPLYGIEANLLKSLSPDLIITQAQCDVCAVRYADVLKLVEQEPRLQKTQILALNPQSLADVLNDISRVGKATGTEQAADSYLASLRGRLDAIETVTDAIPTYLRSRVACIEWIEPIMLAGNWVPELIELAGGRSGLTQAGVHSPYVAWPDIAAYDPEVILVTPCGFDLARTLEEIDRLQSLPGWADCTAVRSRRVYAVDGNAYFNRSGPRLVDTVEILAHLLHPERFAVPKCVSEPEKVWRGITTGA